MLQHCERREGVTVARVKMATGLCKFAGAAAHGVLDPVA